MTPFHIQIYNKLNIVAITVVVAIIKLRYWHCVFLTWVYHFHYSSLLHVFVVFFPIYFVNRTNIQAISLNVYVVFCCVFPIYFVNRTNIQAISLNVYVVFCCVFPIYFVNIINIQAISLNVFLFLVVFFPIYSVNRTNIQAISLNVCGVFCCVFPHLFCKQNKYTSNFSQCFWCFLLCFFPIYFVNRTNIQAISLNVFVVFSCVFFSFIL